MNIKKIEKKFDKTIGNIVVLEANGEWYNGDNRDILLGKLWGKKIKKFYRQAITQVVESVPTEEKFGYPNGTHSPDVVLKKIYKWKKKMLEELKSKK